MTDTSIFCGSVASASFFFSLQVLDRNAEAQAICSLPIEDFEVKVFS